MERLLTALLIIVSTANVMAAEHVLDFVVDYKQVNFTGKPAQALAVNNQIPAPTLLFKEGDKVTINVHNQLCKDTAIHWHGIILPWQMDGVSGITQEGIPPGGVFQYQFTLEQSGTYWYHAHADLQEQQGIYGAFIVEPLKAPTYEYTKDYVIVLSDWSNTHPDQILANLKKEGDYYSPDFPMQPSLRRFMRDYSKANKAERKQLNDDYKMMQQMRMSIYDINDVAYDAYLLNGHTKCNPWMASVTEDDIVRLRFIGAAGSSIFHVKLPDNDMQVVHVQGNDVEPYTIKDFTIAPGETLDVLVKIKNCAPQIIYAESMDKVGVVYAALVTSPDQIVSFDTVTPFPEPLPVTREMMTFGMMHHGGMSHSMNHSMDHSMSQSMDHKTSQSMDHKTSQSMDHKTSQSMDHKTSQSMDHKTSQSMDHSKGHDMSKMGHDMSKMSDHAKKGTSKKEEVQSQVSKTKYKQLKALVPTNDPNKPIFKTITMTLDGWMDRYIWFINGVPEHHAHPIVFEPNKRYRIIFKNTSMMHHPMHIHGHWFIVRAGHGAYDPLLHTIDMPPGATIVADVDADVSGQWLFHCHLLYHMMSGMSRVFQYSTLLEIEKGTLCPQDVIQKTDYHNRPIVKVDALRPIDPALVKHPMAHHMKINFAHFLDVGADPFNNDQRLTYKGLYGYDYDKLELFINDAEMSHGTVENADLDLFYWHLIDQFWAIKGGVNYYYRPTQTPYWQPGIGIEGMMPYFIETDVRAYFHSGSFKLDLEFDRALQITNNFFIQAGIRSILATKTVAEDDIGSGLNQMRYTVAPYYRVMPGCNLVVQYEYEGAYGSYKNLLLAEGESTVQNTVTFGVSLVF